MLNVHHSLGVLVLLVVVGIKFQECRPNVALVSRWIVPNIMTITCVTANDAIKTALDIISNKSDVITIKASPVVHNLQIYAIENDWVKLRWNVYNLPDVKLPEEYKIICCSNKACTERKIRASPCLLWPDFMCYNSNINQTDVQKISLSAKCKNEVQYGKADSVLVLLNKTTSVPENVNYTVINATIFLKWHHPIFTNGRLYHFIIKLYRKENDSPKISTLPVTEAQKIYKYELPVNHSTSYYLTIYSENNKIGKAVSLNITIPPVKLKFQDNIILRDIDMNSTSKLLIISPITPNTKSHESYIYVVVAEDAMKELNQNTSSPNAIKVEILAEICSNFTKHNLTKRIWIAAELMASNSFTKFTVGDNSSKFSKVLNENLKNKPLSSEPVSIYLVTMNRFKQFKIFETYSLTVSKDKEELKTTKPIEISTAISLHYLLLLLLFLPVIAGLLYRYVN